MKALLFALNAAFLLLCVSMCQAYTRSTLEPA